MLFLWITGEGENENLWGKNDQRIKKEIRAMKIQKWIDDNFVQGAIEWEMDGSNAIKVTDRTGDSLIIPLDAID